MSHSSPRRLASPRALPRRVRPPRERASRPPVRAAASPEALQALKDKVLAVEEELKGVTVTFVGDNESANVAVADALAKALGYTLSPPSPRRAGHRLDPEEIFAEDGEAGLVVAENAVLQQLSTMLRCCVATAGGGRAPPPAATAGTTCLAISPWLADDVNAVESAKANPGAPQRTPRPRDAHLVLSSAEVDGEAPVGVATQAMGAIAQMVDGDPQLGEERVLRQDGAVATGPRCSPGLGRNGGR